MQKEVRLNLRAMSFRLLTLMTHYRHPLDYSQTRVQEATTILNRWLLVIEPCLDGPPLEILKFFQNDCNTPGLIAVLHSYRKNKEGRKLYASMKFLGFFDGICEPDEIKTISSDQLGSIEPGPSIEGRWTQ